MPIQTQFPTTFMMQISNQTPIVWLLRDEFSANESAPIMSPRASSLLIDQTPTREFSISDQRATTVMTANDFTIPYLRSGQVTRMRGLTLGARMHIAGGFPTLGWHNTAVPPGSTNVENGIIFLSTSIRARNTNSDPTIETGLTDTEMQVILVQLETGCDILLKSATDFPTWTHVWRGQEFSSNPYAMYIPHSNGRWIDNFSIAEVISWSPESVNITTPTSDTMHFATTNGEHAIRFNVPVAPISGQRIGVKFRIQDVNNYCFAYIERNSGNTTWDLNVNVIEGGIAGTPTALSTNINPAVDAIKVRTNGESVHVLYRHSGTTWVPSTVQNISELSNERSIAAYADAGALFDLQSIPRTSLHYAVLEEFDLLKA